jgi:hypothetical protein
MEDIYDNEDNSESEWMKWWKYIVKYFISNNFFKKVLLNISN